MFFRITDKALLVCFFLLTLLLPPPVTAGGVADGQNAGSAAGSAILNRYGSSSGLNQNMTVPLMSSGTPMTTVDGTQSFTGQMLCPSSVRFVSVLAQPGDGGDLTYVLVSQDTNYDGTLDYNYVVPVRVSGVCANGIISCIAGTWSNCTYFKWVADSHGRVSLQSSGMPSLGGCYCINNSCGNRLAWSSLDIILHDLGGGVVGAIHAVDPKFAITNVSTEDAAITYYGQDSRQCSQIAGSSGSSSPEQYFAGGQGGAALATATDTEVASQVTDPDSYYSLISETSDDLKGEYTTCSIKRNVAVNESTSCPAGDFDRATSKCIIAPNDYTPRLLQTHMGGGGGGCYFTRSIEPCGGNSIYIPPRICGDPHGGVAKRVRIIYTCGGLQRIIYTDPFEWITITVPACPSCDAQWVQGYYYTSNSNTIDCSHYSGFQPDAGGSACSMDAVEEVALGESISNGCQALESDSKCRLKEEKVDGVYVIRNYAPTHLAPFSSCKTFTGQRGSHQVCKDWWQKDRTYMCQRDATYDFSDLKTRMNRITTTARITESGGGDTATFFYTDARKNTNGSWITESVSTDVFNVMSSESTCDMACKTRKQTEDTEAGLTGNTTQYRTSATSYTFYYRLCTNGTCPLQVGEEVVKRCQCINEFAEATTILMSLNEASKDIICSTGEKR